MPLESSDKEKLIDAMLKLGKGIYERVDSSSFEDREIAEVFNSMLGDVARRNNNYLMRSNQAMEMIGNSSWLKEMFEIIDEQQESLNLLRQCEARFNAVVAESDEDSVDALAMIRKLESNISPVNNNIEELLEEIHFAEEKGFMESDVAAKITRLLEFNLNSIKAMKDDISSAIAALKAVYDTESSRAELAEPIIHGVKKLELSCNQLSLSCFGAGSNIYKISRSVDNIRNDMFRGNTDPTMRDSLKVYGVDHIVLTWRLYNHLMEYEVLKIEQLNNKERCKFGVWLNMTSPQWIRKTPEFEEAKAAHDNLHLHVVACFEACEDTNKMLARIEFEEALLGLERFEEALEGLHSVCIKEGMAEESGTLTGNIF